MSYANTGVLLSLAGANGGTSFPDYSLHNRTMSVFGNAQTSTAQSKFYGSSLLLDGTGDYLRNQDTGIGALTTSLFTLDIWFRPASLASLQILVASRDDSTNPNTFWFLRLGTDGKLTFTARATSGSGAAAVPCNVVTDLTATINVWNHARVARNGTVSISVNSTQASLTGENNTNTYSSSPHGVLLGANIGVSGAQDFFTGNMQDFRFILGTALSTAGAAPGKLLGTLSNQGTGGEPVEDDTGAPAERTIIAVPRNYGSTPTRHWQGVSNGSGDFELLVPASGEFSDIDGYSVIALDDAAGTDYNDLVFGRVETV